MQRHFRLLSTVAVLVSVGIASLSADKVQLRSGQTVDGSFMSADVKVVRLLLANGSIADFPVDDVTSIEFTPQKAPPPPAPDPAKAPAPVTLAAGTALNVRFTETIEVDAAQAGHDVQVAARRSGDGQRQDCRAARRGGDAAGAKVEQAGNFKGADKITLKANSIAFGGRSYDIVTSYVE